MLLNMTSMSFPQMTHLFATKVQMLFQKFYGYRLSSLFLRVRNLKKKNK